MVDSHDTERLQTASEELQKLLEFEALVPKQCPLLVIANKQDLPDAMSVAEITEKLALKSISISRPWFIAPAVATEGQGLGEGLDWLEKAILKQTVGDYLHSAANSDKKEIRREEVRED